MSSNRSITDETLLGYLLLALPEAEQWRIEALAFSDPVLRQRIDDLRELFVPIRALSDTLEPRPDLTASTMAFIERATPDADSGAGKLDARMSLPMFESNRDTRLAWIDSLVALAAGIILLTILLPNIWYSRESARQTSCAANLREFGHMFSVYALGNPDRRIPWIDKSGQLAFAGIYSIRLNGAGLLDSPKWVWCPAVENFDVVQKIPTVQMFMAASESTQENWKDTVGGNYSFNLGNVVDGDYKTPCYYLGRSYFPVLGDSLLPVHSNDQTAAVHGAKFSNVLFDDGRVRCIPLHQKNKAPKIDDPYLNLDMEQAVGYGVDDSCLGPSYQNPFKPVKFQ